MSHRCHQYLHMNARDLSRMDRARTVFFLAVGPPEVHGPHLPLGTDLSVAEALRDMYVDRFLDDYPDHSAVVLPTLPLGADALPLEGSLDVSARTLEAVLKSWGNSLAGVGFSYLVVADNHGGPRHLLALEAAAAKLRRRGFQLLNPFCEEFRMMMSNDPCMTARVRLEPGSLGDLEDLHAGTNETSLVMALDAAKLDQGHLELDKISPPPPGPGARGLSRVFRLLGMAEISDEVLRLGSIMAWSKEGGPGYIGAPAEASVEAGRRMVRFRIEVAAGMIERALRGRYEGARPPLWTLRILRYLP